MGSVYTAAKQTARHLMESTTPGYRFLLRRGLQVRGHLEPPRAPWHNAVLQTRQERDRAIEQVTNLSLPLVADPPKNWDCLAALDCILANTSKRARVLDAGSELYSRILPWLCLYGYKKLVGINLVFKEKTKRGPITYKYGDVTCTDYDPASFDAITCLSVIEHGVDLEAYFREMSRVLKPGGVLITSTDYWHTPIDTKGQQMYGIPVHIFTQPEILQAIELAEGCGFALTSPIDLSCNERVVHWEKVGVDYTFLILTLRKSS
jgi:SAM-dependent methyltransferase